MSFALSLAGDVVEVEAGATTPVGLTVVNKGDAGDRFEVEVEGIDPEWRFIPVPTFGVEPGESRIEKIFLKPPRLPESVAGSYPFVVRVRSLESGETRTAQGLLKLNPFHSLTIEISPKKGVVSPTTKRNDFRLALVNLGNSEHTLQLSAQDPEERCAYEFESDQVVLAPGQQREIDMVADPKQTPLLSSGRLIGFSVIARSLSERNVSASAQAQLEQRSLLSPATLVGLLLLVGAFGAWWTMRPVPPTISLQVPMRAMKGDTVQIKWFAEHADHVKITVGEGGDVVYDSVATGESVAYVLEKDGTIPVVALATRGTERAEDSERIQVAVPPVAALPTIESFEASTKSINLGDSFRVSWKVANATKVLIAPLGIELPPESAEQEIKPTTAGSQTYTLIAQNAEGKTKKATVTVNVVDKSDAAILLFSAEPPVAKEAEGGRTTLSWKVTGAALVELKVGNERPKTVLPDDRLEIVVLAKTGCVLIATDSKQRRTTRRLTVAFEKLPPPVPIDETLVARIKAALLSTEGLEAAGIEVEYLNGTVTLRGTAPDEIQRAQAQQVAEGVAGTDAKIDNQLTLSRP